MILLLGGTSETLKVALALAGAGRAVLVSTATDVPLEVGVHGKIRRRQGRLDEAGMRDLIVREKVSAVVDAGHPYAEVLHETARKAAAGTGVGYFAFARPGGDVAGDDVVVVRDHEAAAREACVEGRPVLLTIGSRFVSVYAAEAAAKGVSLFARVLEHPESIAACRGAGLEGEHVVTGRGPFTVEENRELIRRFRIGVVVTKDSGEAGGFEAKREAARLEGCRFVVVARKPVLTENCFDSVELLVKAVLEYTEERG